MLIKLYELKTVKMNIPYKNNRCVFNKFLATIAQFKFEAAQNSVHWIDLLSTHIYISIILSFETKIHVAQTNSVREERNF